ncbi:LysR substrate-binding domain-containing protein [Streptomyces sp. NPDC005202]|uniref:LysR substrate-binding domain-containing protein n=1 Tax=Streptomyces sp. NPDC005202 TaxID=3157021 RepID=UPI0033B76D4C
MRSRALRQLDHDRGTSVVEPVRLRRNGDTIRSSRRTATARPSRSFEAAAPETLLRLAAQGLGAAVVPQPQAGADLRTLRVDHARARDRITLAWRTDGPAGPAAKAPTGGEGAPAATAASPGARSRREFSGEAFLTPPVYDGCRR